MDAGIYPQARNGERCHTVRQCVRSPHTLSDCMGYYLRLPYHDLLVHLRRCASQPPHVQRRIVVLKTGMESTSVICRASPSSVYSCLLVPEHMLAWAVVLVLAFTSLGWEHTVEYQDILSLAHCHRTKRTGANECRISRIHAVFIHKTMGPCTKHEVSMRNSKGLNHEAQ